jgi:hypothetical protein
MLAKYTYRENSVAVHGAAVVAETKSLVVAVVINITTARA